MARFQVIMTAPGLAPAAMALLEAAGCAVHLMPPYPDAPAIAALARAIGADAILCRQGRVDETVMAAAPKLRIIARHGVGVDEVDVAAARARGILVTNAPGSNAGAVAEHTLALILALVKNLKPLAAAIAGGGWRGATSAVGDVAGKRLGLVGAGAIGREVARLAGAFGMRVFALTPGTAPLADAERVPDLPSLLARSDILSLHCPLGPRTRHLIDAAAIAALPAGAFVINTARGGLIDEAALLAALDRGHLAGAAFDVFEDEPPPAGAALRDHPRLIATPHVAGVTPLAFERMGVMAAECIVAALTGGVVPAERVVSR
jgi:D-3-phosphoglycerate dehydrogenase